MTSKETIFSQCSSLGEITLRAFDIELDSPIIHQWVTKDYAQFWGMLDYSVAQVKSFYRSLESKTDENVVMGLVNGKPSFLLEYYSAKSHPISQHYACKENDKGLHILLAPTDNPIKDFSYQVMRFVMDFLFSEPEVVQVVVEPDRKNAKIHRLNRRVGINHLMPIELGEKKAYLGIVTREQFRLSKAVNDNLSSGKLSPQQSIASLVPEHWLQANREHVRKCISELSHEFLINPQYIQKTGDWKQFSLTPSDQTVEYTFCAKLLPLNHWLVKTSSIQKYQDGQLVELDSLQFILEFYQQLNIPEKLLATYLEEVSATLYSSAFKLSKEWLTAKQLTDASFQQIESGMNEGHPAFLANNGRVGFDSNDFRAYTPEAAQPMQYIWLAAHKDRTHLALSESLDKNELLNQEFDQTLVDSFTEELKRLALNSEDYLLIPVHPWQWFNKLSHLFAADIASRQLVCLGYGDDAYQSQQSIRTFFNLSNPSKNYIKTSLSILNMGFMRGLSADYMRATPAINDWVDGIVKEDKFLQQVEFTLLKELAAIGYRNPYFETKALGNTPYNKMLSALWRESPMGKIKENQNLMTMAGLLHQDPKGKSLLVELISASELGVEVWLERYFKAYLTPLLHCFYQYDLVFMPHGENIILVMEDYAPVKAIMKDIGEEICLLNSNLELPELVKRISIKVPEEEALLAIFTDVFDGFFRYMSAILLDKLNLSTKKFWQSVADVVIWYQKQHPALRSKFEQHDIFQSQFKHSCLNRLQLKNNQQMVDLADPANSLQFAGELDNPLAVFRPLENSDKEQSKQGKNEPFKNEACIA